MLTKEKEKEFLSKINRNSYFGGQRKAFSQMIIKIVEIVQDLLDDKEKIKEGKNRIIELINKDINLRTLIKNNPSIKELDRHIYLGFEPYTIDKINNLIEQKKVSKKSNTNFKKLFKLILQTI